MMTGSVGWRTLLHLLATAVTLTRSASASPRCPIGYEAIDGESLCYRMKEPESYDAQFSGCAGNLYSWELLRRLRDRRLLEPSDDVHMWGDYRNMYRGGIFFHWPFDVEERGKVLKNSSMVLEAQAASAAEVEQMCTAGPATGSEAFELTAVSCLERRSRYCLVRDYDKQRDTAEQDNGGCPVNYTRFYSPTPTCLLKLLNVRATWRQAQKMCTAHNGTLPMKGWRYTNHKDLDLNRTIPLGIQSDPTVVEGGAEASASVVWDASNQCQKEGRNVPDSDWAFSKDEMYPSGAKYVALESDTWRMVNDSYVFHHVICEQPVCLPRLSMEFEYDENKEHLLLIVKGSVSKKQVACFTDSADFPSIERVGLSSPIRRADNTLFKVDTRSDGYYWCEVADTVHFQHTASRRVLYKVQSLKMRPRFYALKVRLSHNFNMDKLDEFGSKLEDTIERYIKIYSQQAPHSEKINFSELAAMANTKKSSDSSEDMIEDLRLRRAYLDQRTLLYHVRLKPAALPLPASTWPEFRVLAMKPLYYCPAMNDVPSLSIDQETSVGCVTYRCLGDFNEGVQWVTIKSEFCPSERISSVTVAVNVSGYEAPKKVTTASLEGSWEDSVVTAAELTTTDLVSTQSYSTESVSTVSTPPPATEAPSTEHRPPPVTITTPPSSAAPPPPEQVVTDAVHILEDLVTGSDPIPMAQMNSAVQQVNEALEMATEVNIPGRLFHLIDEVGARLDLNGSQSATLVRDNIGLVVANSSEHAPVRGLRLAFNNSNVLAEDAFHILNNDVDDYYKEQNASEILVQLPDSVVNSGRRITFVVFRNSNAFAGAHPVNSRVLSVNVTDLTTFDQGEYVNIHLRPHDEQVPEGKRRACAYWHFNEDDTGFWSQDGCTFIPSNSDGQLDVCRCTHLTHFAEILAPRSSFSTADEIALEVISIAGCMISFLGLVIIGLTAILFRSWRRDFTNKVWLQLSASILLLVITFLVVVFANFDGFSPGCMAVGIILHYATLASFCWMLVAAVLSYRRLVLVFTRDGGHKLLKACGFAWGIPAVIVAVLLIVDSEAYSARINVEYPAGSLCYPTGLELFLTIYTPIAIALLVNWVLFGITFHSVFMSRRIQRHGDTGETLRCVTVSSMLVFLFGLPWIFGLFVNMIAFSYLFALTATFQGFVLFLFFVVGNKKTRDLWLNQLKIKQMQKIPVTSSTYNRSGYRGGGGGGTPSSSSGAAAMEEANAKPRSLAARDDPARFS